MQNHNEDHPDVLLTIEDVMALHMMRNDAKLENFIKHSPACHKLQATLKTEAVDEYIAHLTMNADECLLLKECMMVSYAGWDEMKARSGLPVKHSGGSGGLKELAKHYNSILKDKLGFSPITQVDQDENVTCKGYRVGMKQLHQWIIDRAIHLGKLIANKWNQLTTSTHIGNALHDIQPRYCLSHNTQSGVIKH